MGEPTFILLEADQFDATLSLASSSTSRNLVSQEPVRRPYRGIEIREDTYATLQVWKASGTRIPVRDSGGKFQDSGVGSSYAYANFVIQTLTESREEKFQLTETFGEDYAFFFGERPRFVRVGAKLVNSPDFNWRSEWWHNYDNTFRGTQLVTQGARIYLTYETVILEGYLINSQTTQTARNPYEVDLAFGMWVTGHRDVSSIGSASFPKRGSYQELSVSDVKAAQSLGGSSAVPSSLAVRQANIVDASQNKISGLVDALTAALDAVSTATGFIGGGIDYFKNIVMGKQVRIPAGYMGSELLTQLSEVASGSLPAGVTSVSGLSQKVKINLGQPQNFPGSLPVRTKPLRGNIYEDNSDEYAQGGASGSPRDYWYEDPAGRAQIEAAFQRSSALEESAAAQLEFDARKAFASYGIDPDFYIHKDVLFAARIAYGVTMYGVATGLEQRRKTEAGYLAAEAQNRTDYHLQSAGDYNPDLDGINYSDATWSRGVGPTQTSGTITEVPGTMPANWGS